MIGKYSRGKLGYLVFSPFLEVVCSVGVITISMEQAYVFVCPGWKDCFIES